jgi:hypothetical protein
MLFSVRRTPDQAFGGVCGSLCAAGTAADFTPLGAAAEVDEATGFSGAADASEGGLSVPRESAGGLAVDSRVESSSAIPFISVLKTRKDRPTERAISGIFL